MSNDQFKTNWLNNSRLIWLNNATEVTHTSNVEDMSEEQSAVELIGLLQELEDRCSMAAEEGEETIARQLCSLAEAEKFSDMLKVKQFVNDLGEQYLNTLQGEDSHYQTKDMFERGYLLETITDFDRLLELMKKCKEYKIIPYPGKVIFKFRDGKKEEMPLEFTKKQKKRAIGRGLKGLRVEEIKAEEHEFLAQSDNPDDIYEQMERIRAEQLMNKQSYLQEVIGDAPYLSTPEAAYHKTKELAPSLDDDLLKEISEPLSEAADIWKEAQMSYGDDYVSDSLSAGRHVQLQHLGSRINDAFEAYYSNGYDDYLDTMDEKQQKELGKIEDTFGISIF